MLTHKHFDHVLGSGAFSDAQIFCASSVFDYLTTSADRLRLDALTLLIVWYLPSWTPPRGQVSQAWIVAATYLPISFGWAAGDVSLAAYIQASLARKESEHPDVSALGAVMAFLYSTYIVIYAITQPLLGRYVDRVFARTGGSSGGGTVQSAVQNIAGVQFTIISVCMLAATCVPKGALKFNPTMLYGEALDKEVDQGDDESSASESLKTEKIEKADNYGDLVAVAQPGGRNSIVGTLQPVDDTKRGTQMS